MEHTHEWNGFSRTLLDDGTIEERCPHCRASGRDVSKYEGDVWLLRGRLLRDTLAKLPPCEACKGQGMTIVHTGVEPTEKEQAKYKLFEDAQRRSDAYAEPYILFKQRVDRMRGFQRAYYRLTKPYWIRRIRMDRLWWVEQIGEDRKR